MIEQEAPQTPEQKDKAVEAAVKDLTKEFGENTLVTLGKRETRIMPSIPTGLFSIDYDVIGVGGFPRGRITEVYGPEASGKTTMALLGIAQAQAAGGRAAIVDAEHSLDPNWAHRIGVDVDNLLVSQPECGEDALRIVERLVESQAIDIIVVDSVAALVPKAELNGEIGDAHMGLQARMMSQALRILAGKVRKSNCALLFINQVRDKIGVVYGSPETTTGGKALKFYASVRLDVRRSGWVKDGEQVIGHTIKVKGAKNKVSSPFREAHVDLVYERGFDRLGNLVDVAVSLGIIEKSGSWYSFGGERLGQGKDKSIEVLMTKMTYEELLKRVLDKQFNKENK